MTTYFLGYREEPTRNNLEPFADIELLRIFAERDDGAVVLGTACEEHVNDVLAAMATQLGYSSNFDLLVDWSTASDHRRFTDAQDQALAPPPPPAWSDTDPDTRSLRPGDIPPEVRSRLDVRAAIIDLTDLGEPNNVLRRRTDSGVANGISEPALGSAIPLHFVPGDDQTLEVVIAPNPTALGDVVLTAPIDEIAAGAGFLISGSIKDRTIELRVLDEIELAARLGTTVDALRSFATMRCSGEPTADSTARTPRRCRPHVESRGGQRRDHR